MYLDQHGLELCSKVSKLFKSRLDDQTLYYAYVQVFMLHFSDALDIFKVYLVLFLSIDRLYANLKSTESVLCRYAWQLILGLATLSLTTKVIEFMWLETVILEFSNG